MRVWFIAALIVAALLGASTARAEEADARRELLVGRWFGDYEDPETGLVQFNSQRNRDGTYAVVFRRFSANGSPYEESEAGKWALDGDTYSTVFEAWLPYASWERTDDWLPADPDIRDEYRVIGLTADAFDYEHRGTGNVFHAKRVSDDFEFPLPPGTVEPPQAGAAHEELSEEARAYVLEIAPLLRRYFENKCLAAPNSPRRIAELAAADGWKLNYEETRKEVVNISWTSTRGLGALTTGSRLFILDVSFEPKENPTAVKCSISVFGSSTEPPLGRREFDLVTEELSKSFSVGETIEMPPDQSKPSKPQFHMINATLADDEHDLSRMEYLWWGGVHSLSSYWTARAERRRFALMRTRPL